MNNQERIARLRAGAEHFGANTPERKAAMLEAADALEAKDATLSAQEQRIRELTEALEGTETQLREANNAIRALTKEMG